MKRRWTRLLAEPMQAATAVIAAMTDRELRRLRDTPNRISQTNCWWVSYHAAPLLAEIARLELQSRRISRRHLRAKK